MGLQIQVLNASTRSEIEAAFATLVRDRADALYIAGDALLHEPARPICDACSELSDSPRELCLSRGCPAGGLMGYDTDRAGMYRQVGTYTGQILKGAKPADLPVLQSTKLSSSSTCKRPGRSVRIPPTLLARADEVIE